MCMTMKVSVLSNLGTSNFFNNLKTDEPIFPGIVKEMRKISHHGPH